MELLAIPPDCKATAVKSLVIPQRPEGCRRLLRGVSLMLKSRVITAVVLLALLLAALFALPSVAWTLLVVAMVMQGGVEWARLSGLNGGRAMVYSGVTPLLLLGLRLRLL